LDAGDLDAAFAVFDGMCQLRGFTRAGPGEHTRGKYDPHDFDADELGLDPEDDFDA